ncbi:MAG: hypothetical protein FWE57_03325 [Chitinispirillia bacterium]|nr:hypothetical protein [Chitinispirillia bacterium]
MKQRRCEKKLSCKKQKGSTIVGVLVATVFISVVTTVMVNNTKSQSELSRGYGTVSDVSSTLNSGIIATQRHLTRPVAAQQFLGIAQARLNGQELQNTSLIAGIGGARRSIGARQAFNSQIIGNSIQVLPAQQQILGAININSGRNEIVNQGGFQRISVVFGQFAGINFIQGFGNEPGLHIGGETNVISNQQILVIGDLSSDEQYQHQANVTVTGIAWLPNGRLAHGGAAQFNASTEINEPLPLGCRSGPFDMTGIEELGNAFRITTTGVVATNNGAPIIGPTIYTLEENINISVPILANAFEHALTNNRLFFGNNEGFANANENNNNGHLVIEINQGVNWPNAFANNIFSYTRPNNVVTDINIIFVVNTLMGGNGLPASTETSRTMIYLAPPRPVTTITCMRIDGTIRQVDAWETNCREWENEVFHEIVPVEPEQFTHGGELGNITLVNNFRGVIFTSPLNTNNQRFFVDRNMTLTGGIQMNGVGNFELNGNMNATLLTIEADRDVLNGFGIPRLPILDANNQPVPPDPDCGIGVTLNLPAGGGVNFTPFSFYYF